MAEIPFNAREITLSLRDVIAEDVQEIGLAALRNVVVGSPVGNPTLWQFPDAAPEGYVGGHFRRNWRVSVGSPDGSVVGAPGRGPGEFAARSEAIGQGTRELAKFRMENQRLYLQNNVPYGPALNNGHSTQAPRNFVEMSVQAANNTGRNRREVLD